MHRYPVRAYDYELHRLNKYKEQKLIKNDPEYAKFYAQETIKDGIIFGVVVVLGLILIFRSRKS